MEGDKCYDKSFIILCSGYFKDKSCDEIMDLVETAALCALEKIAIDKGITDYSKYPEIAVQISHSIENEMRDYIDYHSDKEYMKNKTNLQSLHGMMVEDTRNADCIPLHHPGTDNGYCIYY